MAREQIDSVVYSVSDIDSLAKVMAGYVSAGNTYGEMVAARELGKKLRNASRFYNARACAFPHLSRDDKPR